MGMHGSAYAAHREVAAQFGRTGVQEGRDTACPVAALFDLGAVGIENSIEHAAAGVAGALQHQRLIEAHAGMPVGKGA